MPKTTVNLEHSLRLRLEQLAARSGRTLTDVISELLDDALRRRVGTFSSHAAGDADVDDLGIHAEKYLHEGLG